MDASRDELQELLAGLEADMPWMVKAYPDRAEFREAFAGQVELITKNASATDDQWASEEINRIRIKFGFVDDFAP